MIKVSVLMPIYKTKPEYLREAIMSVLAQSFSDFEFLILDDCPSESCEKIVKSFKDRRIKYIKNKKNLGITPSRNKLIDLAKGEYLAIMDHDDIALPNRFEKQVKVLDTYPRIGVVGCQMNQIPKNKVLHYPEHNQEIIFQLMQGCAIPHTGAMIRKNVLKNIRYESKFSPAEDYALWVRLIGKTQFYNIPEILMKYRWYSENTSNQQVDQMKNATAAIHHLLETEYADIIKKTPYIVRMKLFGLIPIGKFIQYGNKQIPFLKYMPFIKTKAKVFFPK